MQGTSRGGADIKSIVKRLDLWGVNMLFVIGGNGGNAAANAIQKGCEEQNVECSVVGVPKSIDNDILLVRPLQFVPNFVSHIRVTWGSTMSSLLRCFGRTCQEIEHVRSCTSWL